MKYIGKAGVNCLIHGIIADPANTNQDIAVTNKPTFKNIVNLAKSRAIIFTEEVSMYSHESLLFHDYFIPYVSGIKEDIKDSIGQSVTILCKDGKGYIYDGFIDIEPPKNNTKMDCAFTSTKKGMNYCKKRGAVINATRGEFIYLQLTDKYPLKLLEDDIDSQLVHNAYIDILDFASTNFERVIHRLSDFSGENLSQLFDFDKYETLENNSFIGNRGGGRLLSSFRRYLLFEVAIAKTVHQKHKNLEILLPFVRKLENAIHLSKLVRQDFSGKIGCMLEVPLMIYEFSKLSIYFDFFVIGTSDLLQLVQGLDRKLGGYSESAHDFLAELLIKYVISKNSEQKDIFIVSPEVYYLLPQDIPSIHLLQKG